MTQKAYARREGVNYHTLVAWLGQSRRHAAPPVAAPALEASTPRFAQLAWPPAAALAPSRLEVVLPDGRHGARRRCGREAGSLARAPSPRSFFPSQRTITANCFRLRGLREDANLEVRV